MGNIRMTDSKGKANVLHETALLGRVRSMTECWHIVIHYAAFLYNPLILFSFTNK
jgi:hypothetical protein